MYMQNDPFDQLFPRLLGRTGGLGTGMAMDAYRRGDDVWIHLDLPGVAEHSIDVSVERNVLTVTAEREWYREDGDQVYLAERPHGSFRRQIHLGQSLEVDAIEASFDGGVLTLRVPVAAEAKPRKVEIGGRREAIDVSSSESSSESSS